MMLNGYPPLGMLDGGMLGSMHMVSVLNISLLVSNDHGKVFFRNTMSQAATLVGGSISAWLSMVSVLLGVRVLQMGLGFCIL